MKISHDLAVVTLSIYLEAGFFRREIADAAFAYQREVDARRKLIVGVNAFAQPEPRAIETLALMGKAGRGILRRLAAGAPQAERTREASAALER